MFEQKRFQDDAFVEKLVAVGASMEKTDLNKSVDICLTKLFSTLEAEYKNLKVVAEEKKALAPLK